MPLVTCSCLVLDAREARTAVNRVGESVGGVLSRGRLVRLLEPLERAAAGTTGARWSPLEPAIAALPSDEPAITLRNPVLAK